MQGPLRHDRRLSRPCRCKGPPGQAFCQKPADLNLIDTVGSVTRRSWGSIYTPASKPLPLQALEGSHSFGDLYLRAMCFRTAMPNLSPEFSCLGTDPKRYTNAPHYQRPRSPQAGPLLLSWFPLREPASHRPSHGKPLTHPEATRLAFDVAGPSKASAKFCVSTLHPAPGRQSPSGKIGSTRSSTRIACGTASDLSP